MFKRVLIVDDHDAIINSILQVLDHFDLEITDTAQYCDDAYLKYKKAKLDNQPYDLIITDLSFKPDHRSPSLISGEELIARLRIEDKDTVILVYSMKDQLQKVRQLVGKFEIGAYVCKDRNGTKELHSALKSISKNKLYLSPQVAKAMDPNQSVEIEDFDIQLLNLLAKGKSQDEISQYLKRQRISPSSLSSIEKRLNKLRIQFKAKNAIHLVAQAKDLGLI